MPQPPQDLDPFSRICTLTDGGNIDSNNLHLMHLTQKQHHGVVTHQQQRIPLNLIFSGEECTGSGENRTGINYVVNTHAKFQIPGYCALVEITNEKAYGKYQEKPFSSS